MSLSFSFPQATRVHAVCVSDNEEYFYQRIDAQLETQGLTLNAEGNALRARDLVDIIDGYKGLGYSRSTEEELGLLVSRENCSICHCTAGAVEPLRLVRFWPDHFLCQNNDIHIYLGGVSLLSLQLIVACWRWGV